MFTRFRWAFWCLRSLTRDQSDLVLENLALRHQLLLLQRRSKKPKARPMDRLCWSILSQAWARWHHSLLLFRPETVKTFLENHLKEIIAIDFFVVPTVTFRLLYGFIVMAHDRRRVLPFAVTQSPSARWTGQQLVNALAFQTAPRFLLREIGRAHV